MKIYSSTWQLLRFPFSVFLMPVFWFALFLAPQIDVARAVLVFFILHVLVYPASNGYNSYIDRDTSSIGGVKNPQLPTKQLYVASILLNVTALVLSLRVGPEFALGVLIYILASLAYSSRAIRLKKYAVAGYLTVIICQGSLIFYLVYAGISGTPVPPEGMIGSALLIGGMYPLTQVYQHREDAADGVHTMSILLGYRGTFIFAGIIYALAFAILYYLFLKYGLMEFYPILMLFMLPVMAYFAYWFTKVIRDTGAANFENTMRMNLLASVCANAGFFTLLILK